MKNKKRWMILIAILVIAILIVAATFLWKGQKDVNPKPSQGEDPTSHVEVEKSKYVMEEKNDIYHARTLESENKEDLILFIETNIFEDEKNFTIEYDSTKYILNTTKPLLNGIAIQKGESKNTFTLTLEPLQNYSVTFMKKAVKSVPSEKDITIHIGEKE